MAEKSEVQEKTVGFGTLALGLATAAGVIAAGSLLGGKTGTLEGELAGIAVSMIGGVIAAFVIHAYVNPNDS